MRIRTIKPEFWQDEDLARASDKAKLLAIGLLNCADDEGYFKANTRLIQSAVFPYSPGTHIEPLLDELSAIGYIALCTGTDGKEYGLVVKFILHQVVNRPSESRVKEFCTFTEDSLSPHGELIRERKGKEGKGTGKGRPKPGEYTKDFLAFWQEYPKKTGKGAAFEKWIQLNPPLEKILAALAWQKKSRDWQKDNGQYIPHPKTYLNQRRWEDEPPQQMKRENEAQSQEEMAESVKAGQEKAYGRGVVR